jgi:phosphatidylserine/phosphatidylglycerophosphate/cardiolipin synthase-like enzyme
MAMAVTDFFLPELTGGDDVFVGPRRDGVAASCFVDGHDTFAAMELSAARAKASVFLSTWMFGSQSSRGVALISPTRVRTVLKGHGITARPTTWVELFEALAGYGVDIRIILADFDGVMAPGNHESTWLAHETIFRAATRAERAAGARNLHVLASLHPATVDTVPWFGGISGIMLPKLTKIVARIANLPQANRIVVLQRLPGIWPFVDVSATFVPTVKTSPTWQMFPVSHHQKLLVIDAEIAYCGGLDLAVPRADTQRHDSTVRRWHDVHCRVDGAAAFDLARGFVGRWTLERAQFDARVGALIAAQTRLTLPTQTPTKILASPAAPTPSAGPVSVQILRTSSKPKPGLLNPTEQVRDDVRRSYQNAIERATKYVYIENQYVRDERIADWVLTAASANSKLEVIIVVPVAPEEVDKDGKPKDEITDDGMAMQTSILARLTDKLDKPGVAPRFGIYSIVAKAPRGKVVKPTDSPPAPPGYPSRQIYLHSKVLIVDDEFAIVGSANANPRSFKVDTEACIAIHHPATVTALRLTLWRELLGNPAGLAGWPIGSYVPHWQSIADANRAAATPQGRQGFVIPHDSRRFPGTSHPLIPDMWAGLTEEDWEENDALA